MGVLSEVVEFPHTYIHFVLFRAPLGKTSKVGKGFISYKELHWNVKAHYKPNRTNSWGLRVQNFFSFVCALWVSGMVLKVTMSFGKFKIFSALQKWEIFEWKKKSSKEVRILNVRVKVRWGSWRGNIKRRDSVEGRYVSDRARQKIGVVAWVCFFFCDWEKLDFQASSYYSFFACNSLETHFYN